MYAGADAMCRLETDGDTNVLCRLLMKGLHSRKTADLVILLAKRRLMDHAGAMQQSAPQRHRPRRSGCADAALRAEIERVRSMTVEERIKAALSMRQRFSWLHPVSKQN